MHAQKGQQHPFDKSRQLQRRLYLAANSSRGRRFHALFDRIDRPDIVWRAWIEYFYPRDMRSADLNAAGRR